VAVLAGAPYRSDQAVQSSVVIRWKKGLPKGRDEAWFVMTDRDRNAVRRTDLFARRTAVEELFRDGTDGRYGLGLGPLQVETASRRDSLILIVARILLSGLGRIARGRWKLGMTQMWDTLRIPRLQFGHG
jgi:hypothetical protein